MTNISFTNKELELLNKGLKCNLHSKPKTWIKTLALEADAAIRLLPQENQAYMKQLVANNIKKLVNKQKQEGNNNNGYIEWHRIKNIKQKLTNNQAIITKADKGNTLISINENDYNNKIEAFISIIIIIIKICWS
jgi:hypothetical protein